MFTIHNHFIPFMFCLLPNKHKDIYTQIFRMLCNECDKLNLKFLPQTIYVDFEEAIHYPILSVWPETNIKGCRFHLGQSLSTPNNILIFNCPRPTIQHHYTAQPGVRQRPIFVTTYSQTHTHAHTHIQSIILS